LETDSPAEDALGEKDRVMKAYADLADLPEDERIRVAVETTIVTGAIVGIFVDDDEKAARYIEKFRETGRVRVIDHQPVALSATSSAVLIRIGPKK
jgi:hypothetical protein